MTRRFLSLSLTVQAGVGLLRLLLREVGSCSSQLEIQVDCQRLGQLILLSLFRVQESINAAAHRQHVTETVNFISFSIPLLKGPLPVIYLVK